MSSKELQRRLREHKGRQLMPDFKSQLSRFLGHEIENTDFVGIETTEELRSKFFEKIKNSRIKGDPDVRCKIWDPTEIPQIWAFVANIASCVDKVKAVLFHRLDEYTGAVLVPARTVLVSAEAVWGIVGGPRGQDLCLSSIDLASGFCLEFDHYADRDEYELTMWGVFERCADTAE